MHPRLPDLFPYPFERLALLLKGVEPGGPVEDLGIGEPRHATPPVLLDAIRENLHLLGKYPPTAGTPELRTAISDWMGRRFQVSVDPDRQVLPVSGSREALFSFAQAVVDSTQDLPAVLLPNPFYQIYEGAAILAGAEPVYVPTPRENRYLPDWTAVPAEVWPRVKLAYVCSPGNPAGAVLGLDEWRQVFALSERYGFVVASDEPYSEIYGDVPPLSALQAADQMGVGWERLVVFNSLSKRSSAPGLRSGFVAGGEALIQAYLKYRTYHGAAPSLLVQAASTAAWQDEAHVEENRDAYRRKFAKCQPALDSVLPCSIPDGGFFLWAQVPVDSRWRGDDQAFARDLYAETGVKVLPGSYLGRESLGVNPGSGHVRIALVAAEEDCARAIHQIAVFAG